METLFLLGFVAAVGFALYFVVFSKSARGGLQAATSTDPALPKLDDEQPPVKWGTEVRTLVESNATARQTFDVLKIGLPVAFPGELIAVPKSWAPNPLPDSGVVVLEGVLGEKWFVQAADEAKAKRLLSLPAFKAAVEPMFQRSRIVYIEKNYLYVGAKYEPEGDERAQWETAARNAAAALRAELKATAKKR